MNPLYLNVWSIVKSTFHVNNHRHTHMKSQIMSYVNNKYNSEIAKLLRSRADSLKLLIKSK